MSEQIKEFVRNGVKEIDLANCNSIIKFIKKLGYFLHDNDVSDYDKVTITSFLIMSIKDRINLID